MQTPQASQRSIPRRAANTDSSSPQSQTSAVGMAYQAPQVQAAAQSQPQVAAGSRTSSSSARSQSQKKTNPSQQLSQIEKSVTHLLVATKQLLETLTQWSRHNATEAEVSDVYVRLGYEFNIASRAFNAIGVDTTDLGNVPDLLRSILEDTLSQDASPASLDRYLPRIRDIIINLLHGLKRKQQKLRQRQGREEGSGSSGSLPRQSSIGSIGGGENGANQLLDEPPSRVPNASPSSQYLNRSSSKDSGLQDESAIPPRTSSVAGGRASPMRQDQSTRARTSPSNRTTKQTFDSPGASSTSGQTIPQVSVADEDVAELGSSSQPQTLPRAAAPPKQDALAALQRGGDLERRASRRYSAYHLSKHLGPSSNGIPMLPPTQTTPIPNRGRDVRESMNAVRTRGSLIPDQRSTTRSTADNSPSAKSEYSQTTTDDGSQRPPRSVVKAPTQRANEETPLPQTPEDKAGSYASIHDISEQPVMSATLNELPGQNMPAYPIELPGQIEGPRKKVLPDPTSRLPPAKDRYLTASTSATGVQEFIPEQSPQPGKELTLFLQYKSKIKKFVLPDGANDLTVARLQLAFIEKFSWNTHSNGIDLPEIYIQDPVSGVRHELEDLADVKDRSVLVLNVEALDEVKKHIDEGLSGIKKLVEGVRYVMDGQQVNVQRVLDRQQAAAKDLARIAVAPPVSNRLSRIEASPFKGVKQPVLAVDSSSQASDIQSLRRDLAVVRQTYSSFASDVQATMVDIKSKAGAIKTVTINAATPTLDGASGRVYLNKGKKEIQNTSDALLVKVEDLQDVVEDLRKDVVTRGVRPLPRQLEDLGKEISLANSELKRMQEFLKREKPKWTKIWEQELQVVCEDRDLLTMQETLCGDLREDLDGAMEIFGLVEEATKQQMKDGQGTTPRSTSRGLNAIVLNSAGDPHTAKEGVLGEVRALQPNHENRLEAIERAEKARQRELESRRGGEFQKELGSFVEEGKLKKSGGVEEAERLRKAKDDRIRREVWERQNARAKGKETEKPTNPQQQDENTPLLRDGKAEDDAPLSQKEPGKDVGEGQKQVDDRKQQSRASVERVDADG